MYMTPTVPLGGGLCAIHAAAHFPALASKHIGSGPGVSGASGMQVQPLLPLRTTFIAPPAPTVTIDALWAIAAGAADSALLTGSLPAAFARDSLLVSLALPALLHPASASDADAVNSMSPIVRGMVMVPSC